MEMLTALALATTLGVPGLANANASIAAADRTVAVVWSASTPQGATWIYEATSRDGGRVFSAPLRVSAPAGDARVGGEQPPQVAIVARAAGPPALVVVWTAKGQSGTVLESSRSADGGRTFSPPAVVEGSDAPGNRGWESLVVDARGRAGLVWLDHRELAPAAAGGEMAHHMEHEPSPATKADGVARAQLSKLYFTVLNDRAPAKAIAAGVCYCCKTAIAAGPDGSIYTAWRHVYPGNLRDIAFAVSRDGGATFGPPVRVSEDQWAIDGCPENGPAIGIDARGRAHVVWPTLVRSGQEESLALFYSVSAAGRRFSSRLALPTEGVPRHPRMVVAGGNAIVLAWDERSATGSSIAIASGAIGAADGVAKFERLPATSKLEGVYPVLAKSSAGVLVAWTNGPAASSTIQVRLATDSEGRPAGGTGRIVRAKP